MLCLASCQVTESTVNKNRKAFVETVARDLRQRGKMSEFYRNSDKWVKIRADIWVLTRPKYEVRYYAWPLGPFSVLNVEANKWHFEE